MSAGYHMEDEVQQQRYDATLMSRLLRYVRPYRYGLAAAIILLFVVSVVSNTIPLLNMRAVDGYINNPERVAVEAELETSGEAAPALVEQIDRLREGDLTGLHRLIFMLGALMATQAVIRYLQTIIVSYIGERTMLVMRMEIFAHLQRMSLRFLDKNPIGRMMTRVTTDVERIQQTIVSGMVQVANDLFSIVVIVTIMLSVNWALALITLSTVPFVFVTSYIFRLYARRAYLEIRKLIASVNAYMQECVSGIRIVQIFGQEQRAFREFDRRNAAHRDEWLRQVRNYAIYFPTVDFLGTFTMALTVLYIGYQLLGAQMWAQTGATVGGLFAYLQWGERLFQPIRALADRYNMLLEAMASSERIFSLLDTPPEIESPPEAVPCTSLRGEIEFRNVWFAYEGEQWVLKDVSFTIAPGERIAVVGHTGAGKSTLINLLSRFYDAQRGEILVDGVNVRDYDLESLRRQIGIVLQDVFLFSGSIERNIRLGNEALSDEHVRACASYVNAARFIERLPGGYAYDVGERGCNLSTGQRQLLAFARVLAHEPSILVLDEATSNVDTETEALIQDAIAKLMRDRTSIVIAHRLSTVQHADRIMVMHHGEIRESGTHQELLRKGGLYYTLYQLQYKDQDVSESNESDAAGFEVSGDVLP